MKRSAPTARPAPGIVSRVVRRLRLPCPVKVAWVLCVMVAGVGLPNNGWSQGTLYTISSNGPVANRVNLVVLSEGYLTNQLPQFLVDATNLVERFLAEQPYQEYRRFFNAFAIAIASTQSGSDHPSQSYYRTTYFNSTYDSYGVTSVLTIPPNDYDGVASHGEGKVQALLQRWLPECDMPMLLVNDPLYGGSGGSVLVVSKSSSATEITRHESGHTFGGLGDEYETAYPGYPDVEEPNTTREVNRERVKWRAWIDQATPVPTPASSAYASAVGLFQGAHYQSNGWYRPKLECKMRMLDVPFCEVCREALVLAMYGRMSPIDAALPATTNLSVTVPQALDFSVSVVQPLSHQPTLQWYTNGTACVGATNATLNLSSSALGAGTHEVMATVRDGTAWVRNDPAGSLSRSARWVVKVNSLETRLEVVSYVRNPATPFSLRVIGYQSNRFVIQGAAHLTDWQPLATNRLVNGVYTYSDSNAPKYPGRYYRALALP